MVGCCILPCSVICCLLHCQLLTLLLPAMGHPLFNLHCPLFNCPPSSFNGGHPSRNCLNSCPLSCLSCSLVWLSLIYLSWQGIALHLIMLLPPVCQRLCLLSRYCLLMSTLTGCCVFTSASPCATASHPPGPPSLLSVASFSCHQLLCPLLLRLIDAFFFCQLWWWAKKSTPPHSLPQGCHDMHNAVHLFAQWCCII